MDLIYFKDDYEGRRDFKRDFGAAFPGLKLVDDDDDVHGARVEIEYSKDDTEKVMKWLIKNGLAQSSLHFNLIAMGGQDKEVYENLKRWIDECNAEKV